MKRFACLLVAVGSLAFLFACTGDSAAPTTGAPSFAVRDGAHDGNPDFFFLPPLFPNPSSDPDFEAAAFNGDLHPTVEICELGGTQADVNRSCVAVVRTFSGSQVNVNAADQQYHVNWNTTESNLSVTKDYRIRVLIGTAELGFADVDPVNTGKELKNVQTGQYIALVDGRTLPIKFRIEDGALCDENATACAAETINLAQGGGIELVAEGEDFKFDIPAGTQATSGGQVVTDVTFNLEACDGIDVDLPVFGQCLRVTTFFRTSGEPGPLQLTNGAALISMCVLEPGLPAAQEDLITLHQQDGLLIRALPHESPNCGGIAARTSEPTGLAARGWRWVSDVASALFKPAPLYATTRTMVFNLGAGGETDLFGGAPPPESAPQRSAQAGPQLAAAAPAPGNTVSDFQFALPARLIRVDATDGLSGVPGAALSPPPAVKVVDAENPNIPVAGATVTFQIAAGGGNFGVTGAGAPITLFRALSNTDGIAQVPTWILGPAAGRNAVTARGRGFAAAPGDAAPFIPDIHNQSAPAVLLPTPTDARVVSFTATAITVALPINCPGDPSGDQVDRGFYVPAFPGTSFDRVTLHFSARTAGTYTFSLTARNGTYDGTVLGTATASVTLTNNDQANVATAFTFPTVAVTPGSTVTFSIAQVAGPAGGVTFYSVPRLGDATCPVVQTNGTEPPLSTFRRQGVHVTIETAPVIP
jgi:hypothetical protein